MHEEPASTEELRREQARLRLDADYLEYEVDELRTRTELRAVGVRLGRTALWTLPLIYLGLIAGLALDAWLGRGLFKAWFSWLGSKLLENLSK